MEENSLSVCSLNLFFTVFTHKIHVHNVQYRIHMEETFSTWKYLTDMWNTLVLYPDH
jgi:hypothetical protein